MARNEEKAQAMLNKFVTAKKDANRVDKSQRPYLATECDNVPDCELYRNQIIKEISKKVSLIQNEGLEEHRVRDLNDAINKLMREKGHWERQIKSLGGPDYFLLAPKMGLDEDSEEVVPGKGYRYYGAAKRLPGVRELFKKTAPERAKRTRFEIFKNIDDKYYGYRDDDDGVLGRLEAEAEAGLLKTLTEDWEKGKQARRERMPGHRLLALATGRGAIISYTQCVRDGLLAPAPEAGPLLLTMRQARREANPQLAEEVEEEEAAQFVAHVAVPDEKAVREAILARRKRELLANLEAGDSDQPVETADLADIKRLPPSW